MASLMRAGYANGWPLEAPCQGCSWLWITGICRSAHDLGQNGCPQLEKQQWSAAMLRHFECHQGVFDPEEVAILTSVFDEAWKAVQDSGAVFALNGESEATREIIARRIIALALLGERDRVRLREDALLYLARQNANG
jgi:hypothetical protein